MAEMNTDWSDTTPCDEDWQAVGWQPGCGVIPQRTIVDLSDHGEVNVLFASDVDYWMVVSAHSVDDGSVVELTERERDVILRELDDQAREQRNDWLADGNYVDARFRARWA
jgi:hypothetical protein